MSSLEDLREVRKTLDALILQKEVEDFEKNASLIYVSNFDSFMSFFSKMPYLTQAKIYHRVDTGKIPVSTQLDISLKFLGFEKTSDKKKSEREVVINSISEGKKIEKSILARYANDSDIFKYAVDSNYLIYFDILGDDDDKSGWVALPHQFISSNKASNEFIKKSRIYQKKHTYTIYWDAWFSLVTLTPERREIVLFLAEEKVFNSENLKLIKEIYP